MAAEPIPYAVTEVDQFSAGRVHGRDAYEGKGRGDPDWEPMPEVRYADHKKRQYPVQVVYPSAPPPVHQVVVRSEPEVALVGEDKIFDQVRLDLDIQRCIFQNICTEEVKAIPGVYLGNELSGDEDWTGRADDVLEVISEDSPAEAPLPSGPGNRAPGRVFVEEPAETR
ncbi:hypothetical protein GCM10009104_01860 [Marinobacterium maritimum]|uniref:Uncharacterized protein n=1 Tax=Marinobacterium maritimum TaxID=500162 RepID=A0ABP3T7Y4_9GAMM